MQYKIVAVLFFMFVSSAANSFDYPIFRVTKNGEFVGSIVGTLHYVTAPSSAPKRLSSIIKRDTDLLVLESDIRKKNIDRVRIESIPTIRSECRVYRYLSSEDRDFLGELAKTTPDVDMKAVEFFYLDEWKEIINARTNMAAGFTTATTLYEGIESVIYRVAHDSDLRFMEKVEEVVKEDNCLSPQDISKAISGFRHLIKCEQCQREKSKESIGYFFLNRKNWKSEAKKNAQRIATILWR